jgi:hypothetical protein
VAKIGCNVMGGWSNEERPIALANNQAQTENRRKHSFVVECWISQADPANGREEKKRTRLEPRATGQVGGDSKRASRLDISRGTARNGLRRDSQQGACELSSPVLNRSLQHLLHVLEPSSPFSFSAKHSPPSTEKREGGLLDSRPVRTDDSMTGAHHTCVPCILPVSMSPGGAQNRW